MAQQHTQKDYGRLLKEYLEKRGVRVGVQMEPGFKGWEGSLRIACGKLTAEDCGDFVSEMHADACVYVDEDGDIRVYYAEPIMIDPKKKAAKDAAEKEHDKLSTLTEDDFAYDDECEEVVEGVQPVEMQPEADLEYISEREELELLRALNEIPYEFKLYNRKNENHLICHRNYRMDACSRNSAKKAAKYICDELFVMCNYIAHLSEKMGFERVKPLGDWSGWERNDVIDDFSQIDGYIAARCREAEEKEATEKRAAAEESLNWNQEWGDPQEIVSSVGKRIEEKDPTLELSEMIRWHIAADYLQRKLEEDIRHQEEENAQKRSQIEAMKEALAAIDGPQGNV